MAVQPDEGQDVLGPGAVQQLEHLGAGSSRGSSARPRVVSDPVLSGGPTPEPEAPGVPPSMEAMVATLEATITSVRREAWSGLETPVVRSLYSRLSRVAEQVSAHKMAAALVLDKAEAAKREGASSTGAMLGEDFGGNRHEGDELVRLGDNLAKAHASATEGAFAAGASTQAQADVIARILNNVPPA